jgi:Ca2+-dependent lipid-binding protein
MQQRKEVKSKKTDVVKKTLNPVFNESFTFKLPNAGLDRASIKITAMQHITGQRGNSILAPTLSCDS